MFILFDPGGLIDECAVPGCKEPYRGRGHCAKHYYRIYRHGTTENMGGAKGYHPPDPGHSTAKTELPVDIRDAYNW